MLTEALQEAASSCLLDSCDGRACDHEHDGALPASQTLTPHPAPRRPGLHLQYKYVVRNGDGSVARWMAGENFEILTSVDDAELPGSLRVSDTWDASKHAIEVPHICD